MWRCPEEWETFNICQFIHILIWLKVTKNVFRSCDYKFIYFSANPKVSSVLPERSVSAGGIRVDVKGEGFRILQRPKMILFGRGDIKTEGKDCVVSIIWRKSFSSMHRYNYRSVMILTWNVSLLLFLPLRKSMIDPLKLDTHSISMEARLGSFSIFHCFNGSKYREIPVTDW